MKTTIKLGNETKATLDYKTGEVKVISGDRKDEILEDIIILRIAKGTIETPLTQNEREELMAFYKATWEARNGRNKNITFFKNSQGLFIRGENDEDNVNYWKNFIDFEMEKKWYPELCKRATIIGEVKEGEYLVHKEYHIKAEDLEAFKTYIENYEEEVEKDIEKAKTDIDSVLPNIKKEVKRAILDRIDFEDVRKVLLERGIIKKESCVDFSDEEKNDGGTFYSSYVWK